MTNCVLCGAETVDSNFCSKHFPKVGGMPGIKHFPEVGGMPGITRSSIRNRRLVQRVYLNRLSRKKLVEILEETLDKNHLVEISKKTNIKKGGMFILRNSRNRNR